MTKEEYRQKAIQEATRAGDLLSENRKLTDALKTLVEAQELFGGGRSMMHPRLSRALSKAQQYLS